MGYSERYVSTLAQGVPKRSSGLWGIGNLLPVGLVSTSPGTGREKRVRYEVFVMEEVSVL